MAGESEPIYSIFRELSGVDNGYLKRDTLYVKFQDPFKMSFKWKFCSFVSVPSLFKKEINAFDSFSVK